MAFPLSRFRTAFGDGLFWFGFGLCCTLLLPVCLLLVCVRGIFCAADWCSLKVKGELR